VYCFIPRLKKSLAIDFRLFIGEAEREGLRMGDTEEAEGNRETRDGENATKRRRVAAPRPSIGELDESFAI